MGSNPAGCAKKSLLNKGFFCCQNAVPLHCIVLENECENSFKKAEMNRLTQMAEVTVSESMGKKTFADGKIHIQSCNKRKNTGQITQFIVKNY